MPIFFKIKNERRPEDKSGGFLVHGDFNPTNILVKDGEVVAILDWEFSHSGRPLMDISNLIRHTPERDHQEIHKNLESSGTCLPEDWPEQCEFYHVGSYLEFLTSQRSDAFKQSCAEKIYRFIQKFTN